MMDQNVTRNENNDLKLQDTMKLGDTMEFKKKKKNGEVEELQEWTDTPPTKDIEYFAE